MSFDCYIHLCNHLLKQMQNISITSRKFPRALWINPLPPRRQLLTRFLWPQLSFTYSRTLYKDNRVIEYMGFPGVTGGKEPSCQHRSVRDMGSIPGLGGSPGGGHDNPLQCSCLENPLDRGTWLAMVHRVAMNWTQQRVGHDLTTELNWTEPQHNTV